MLAFVLFKPSTDDQTEEQTATKDDVKPIKADTQPTNPLYQWQQPVMQTPVPETAPPVGPTPTTPNQRAVPKPEPTPTVKPGVIDYKIQPGDMVSKLAVKHGCTTSDIYKVNDGLDSSNAHKLRVGQTIRIPVGGDTTVSAGSETVGATQSQGDYFPRRVITAAAGDSAMQLAVEHYGSMSLFRMIMNANPDLTWDLKLRGGEQVVLPEFGNAPASAAANAPTHSVERGSLIPGRR
jgi:LysM repeat protein